MLAEGRPKQKHVLCPGSQLKPIWLCMRSSNSRLMAAAQLSAVRAVGQGELAEDPWLKCIGDATAVVAHLDAHLLSASVAVGFHGSIGWGVFGRVG